MNKEELLKELKRKYKGYLRGKFTFAAVYDIEQKLHALAAEETNTGDISVDIKDIMAEINEIEDEIREEYDKDVLKPLEQDLLELLQFEGMVKSVQYKKRAEELKEKLRKYDSLFKAREEALDTFFRHTKIGSRYDDRRKVELTLKLGALDTSDLWYVKDGE